MAVDCPGYRSAEICNSVGLGGHQQITLTEKLENILRTVSSERGPSRLGQQLVEVDSNKARVQEAP